MKLIQRIFKKIVAEAEVENTLIDNPKVIWEITKNHSGITKDFFDIYYEKKDQAIVYKLSKIIAYAEPLSLNDFGIKTAPQSFVYIK